jgi:hypothetical protein
MKLELKHLAPYLPHKLQVSINKNGWEYMISGNSNIAELRGLYGDDICLLYQENEGFDLDFESFELILRPKSDLVKKIEINGKEFVSIIELAKIADCHFKYIPEVKKVIEYEDEGCNVLRVIYKDDRYDIFEMSWGIESTFFDGKNDGFTFTLNDTYACHNVGTIYQKLFKWHFDVFGLIEKGLAIDINTL